MKCILFSRLYAEGVKLFISRPGMRSRATCLVGLHTFNRTQMVEGAGGVLAHSTVEKII